MSAQIAELEKDIAEAVSPSTAKGVDVEIEDFAGDPTKALVKAVVQEGYDILVKAPQGTPGGPLASIDQRILRYAPCPVAMPRPRRADGNGRIVAAVDYDPDDPEENSALNDEILDAAVHAAAGGFGDITVLHAWQLFGESTLKGGFAQVSE